VLDAVRGLGTIVGVWAHPDDEAYLSAGLMAAAVQAGNRVVCVTATRGEHGTSDPARWPPRQLARVREREIAASLASLGVREHQWLAHRDGECARVRCADAAWEVRSIIEQASADTVITFGPDGMTGHPDHVAVSRWTSAAVSGLPAPPRLLYATKTGAWADNYARLHDRLPLFGPDGPPRSAARDVAVALEMAPPLLDRKLAALRAHATQTAPLIEAMGEALYRSWCADEYFVAADTTTDSGNPC
jgi:LmbE family N-acetylglucosaminyl deacetylase